MTDALTVWIDQDECTGDGLCVQYAPEVFEFDIDGLAYVKDATGDLQQASGARVGVPDSLRLDVIDSARECPGTCIHLVDADGADLAGGAVAALDGRALADSALADSALADSALADAALADAALADGAVGVPA